MNRLRSGHADLRLSLPRLRPRVRGAGPAAGSGGDEVSVVPERRPRAAAFELRGEHRGEDPGGSEEVAAAPGQREQGETRRRRGIPQGARGTLNSVLGSSEDSRYNVPRRRTSG